MNERNDELMDAVRASLRGQAVRIVPGAARFDPEQASAASIADLDEPGARRIRGPALVAAAAGVVLLLVVASAILANRGDDESLQTVSPPDVDQPDRPDVDQPDVSSSSSSTTTEAVSDETSTVSVPTTAAWPDGDRSPDESAPRIGLPTKPVIPGNPGPPPIDEGNDGDDGIAPYDPSKVRARLELDATTVAAGGVIKGRVIVNNDSGWGFGIACWGGFSAFLVNDIVPLPEISQSPPPDMAVCQAFVDLPLGESSWPIAVRTTYGWCLPGMQPPPAEGACDPLPTGTYRAEVVLVGGPEMTMPVPVDVVVTS